MQYTWMPFALSHLHYVYYFMLEMSLRMRLHDLFQIQVHTDTYWWRACQLLENKYYKCFTPFCYNCCSYSTIASIQVFLCRRWRKEKQPFNTVYNSFLHQSFTTTSGEINSWSHVECKPSKYGKINHLIDETKKKRIEPPLYWSLIHSSACMHA